MIDLSKLSPAPWTVDRFRAADTEDGNAITAITVYADEDGKEGSTLAEVNRWSFGDDPATPESDANAAFIALARNAFEVMLRRLWHPVVMNVSLEENNYVGRNKWTVAGIGLKPPETPFFDDPFTALVEADRWLTEQENSR